MNGKLAYVWMTCFVIAINLSHAARAAEQTPPVCISEFLAVNQHGLKDEDGDHVGWIEIHNTGSETLNLGGWFLTDNATNLTEWRLPVLSLLPDRYIVVFASGKDRAPDVAHLHTSFRLKPQGGYLALIDRRTNLVSEFASYPEQAADISYGRAPGEPSILGSFMHPTPGRLNATQGPGFAPAVNFSRAGGSVASASIVELTCASPKAVVHYTTDGSLPTQSSAVYHAPLPVTRTLHLRARAYQDGLLPGPPRSETYLVLNGDLEKFTSNLPVLVIDDLGQSGLPGSADAVAHFSMFEPVNGRTSLTNPPSFTSRAGYHVRGSSTMNMPKPSFVVHLLNEFNEEQHHPLLSMPADSDWVLYAPNRFEPVMIHNPFVHELSREMGRYSPRTRFLEVFFLDNSRPATARQYLGIYVLEEKIKVGKHRVNIDRLGPGDIRRSEVTGGYILKLDRLGPNESGFWTGEASVVYVEPKERVISLPQRSPQRQFLADYFANFERALSSPTWKDPVLGYPAYIDVDSWIDYHVLEVLSGNVDALVYSTYFHKPRNGKLAFGPHWDFDRALGSTDGRDDEPRRWMTGRFFSGPWWNRLFRDPDFWQRWVDRWQELREAQFSLPHINGLIDRLSNELREAQPREVMRWDLEPRGGSYQSEIDLMKDWLSNRVDFIDGQLVAKPRLDTVKGSAGWIATLTSASGATLYYTLDGSDPRASQGAVATGAQTYSGPISLPAGAVLVARAYDPTKRQTGGPRSSTPWSGPVKTAGDKLARKAE